MKNVLVESTKSKFQVLAQKPANVLKRIKGVLSDFGSNRNGRIYPRELWENVINSDYVKEMINSHGLVGELDHPEERLEISLQEVSHVINDMWIEGDQVMGIIDILPTPNGKIVNELLDYGTDIGISSRGAGSVGAGNVVDPDYQFITFDFVARPSCEAARLNTILEGVKIDLANNSDEKVNAVLESYKDELNESQSQEIEEVIADMRLNIPNIEEYLSAYYKYINKFEPKPAIYKDTGTFNPDWEEWERNTSNVLFSEEAWNKFVKWVKENYNVELKESINEEYGDRYRTLDEMIKLFKQFSYDYGVKAHREDSRYFQGIADGYEGAAFELEHNLDPEKHKLNEAMSDQEVYKVVLNWYKDQIEAGKMTLNQCYELLSDKAKVSLNKLVDQSKIRESVMDREIKQLLKESMKSLADYDESLRGYNASTAIVIFEAKQYLSKHPFKKDINKAIQYGVKQLDGDVSELESKYGFKDIEVDIDMEAVKNYFSKDLRESKEEGKVYSPDDKKKLKEIYNNLQAGITYGEDMDKEHHSWITYPYFDTVLWLMANSPHTAEEVIGWRHYGSSANKNTVKDLKWILDVIFEMTPTEFLQKYIKNTDSKLEESVIKESAESYEDYRKWWGENIQGKSTREGWDAITKKYSEKEMLDLLKDYLAVGKDRVAFRDSGKPGEWRNEWLIIRDILSNAYDSDNKNKYPKLYKLGKEIYKKHLDDLVNKYGAKKDNIESGDKVVNAVNLISNDYGIHLDDDTPFDMFYAPEEDEYLEDYDYVRYYNNILNALGYNDEFLMSNPEVSYVSDGKQEMRFGDTVIDLRAWDDLDSVVGNVKTIMEALGKLNEAEEFKPNGVVDDIKKRGDGDLDVESPMELNTGVLPVLDTDTYSRQDWIWDPYRYEDEDGNLPEDDDYGPTYEDLDRCMVDYGAPIVEEYLKKVLPSAKVEGTKMYHPSQYNFSSDELEFKVSFDPKEYYALEDKAVKDPAFKDYLRERYKSYDGFVSYLADNLDEFYQQDGWKRFVQVVMFYLRDEDFEETNERYWEDIIGNC